MAKRAGLNPYEYTQVNVREQASWIHSDDAQGTTDKAIHLVKAGIARTLLTEPLEPIVVETTQRTLVVGGGVAGLRAAIGLADIGLGRLPRRARSRTSAAGSGASATMYPTGKNGRELIAELIEADPPATVDPRLHRRRDGQQVRQLRELRGRHPGRRRQAPRPSTVEVGSIVVTTGVDTYEPEVGEYGYGIDGVVTLPEFKALIDAAHGTTRSHDGRPVRSVAYVYCVGSREPPASRRQRVLLALLLRRDGRDVRPAGGARRERPPVPPVPRHADVRQVRDDVHGVPQARVGLPEVRRRRAADGARGATRGGLLVTVRDLLTGGEELAIPADLVVLVTGMVPRRNEDADRRPQAAGRQGRVLQRDPSEAATGRDRRRRRVHRRCLPGPEELERERRLRTGRGDPERGDPEEGLRRTRPARRDRPHRRVHRVRPVPRRLPVRRDRDGPSRATDRWPSSARPAARAAAAACPICPENAIDLLGYTDAQITAMIDKLLEVPVA